MIITQAQWNRRIGPIERNAPAFPNIAQTRAARNRSNSGRAIGILDTFLRDVLGADLRARRQQLMRWARNA